MQCYQTTWLFIINLFWCSKYLLKGNSPLILTFFIVSIVMLCVCLLITAHTLFLYHCSEYEAINFSKSEARFSSGVYILLWGHFRSTGLGFDSTELKSKIQFLWTPSSVVLQLVHLQQWHVDFGTLTYQKWHILLQIKVWRVSYNSGYESAHHEIISGNRIVPEGYEEKIEIEDLQLGMRFHADMLNRVWFVIIILVLCVAFCTTFIQSWSY